MHYQQSLISWHLHQVKQRSKMIMAEANAVKKPEKKPAPKYVTEERFSSLEKSMSDLVGLIKSGALSTVAPAEKETPLEKEVRKAAPDNMPVNPAWDEKAKEILGDYLDHTEVLYLKNGGVVFRIIVKLEKSNAPKEYLERMKVDARSKEVSAEGMEGVENWCKLVKQNLTKGQLNSATAMRAD